MLAGSFSNQTNSSTSVSPSSNFPTTSAVDIANGEENDECLCQVRAKLYKLAPYDEKSANASENAPKGDIPSVPSTKGRMELSKVKSAEEKDASKEEENKTSGEEGGAKETNDHEREKLKLVWKEAGVGPVRVLRRKPMFTLSIGTGDANDGDKENENKQTATARVVQRRETTPGGQGTKLILNAPLIPGRSYVERPDEKRVKLVTALLPEEAEVSVCVDRFSASYLFRTKTSAEADMLEEKFKEVLKKGEE